MNDLGLIAVAAGLAVFSAFMAISSLRQNRRMEDLVREAQAQARQFVELADRRHRAFWTSPDTWIDPDCIECGGEGAACCDPPTYPYTKRLEGVEFTTDPWLAGRTDPPRSRHGRAIWDALDDMQTGSFRAIRPEDPEPQRGH